MEIADGERTLEDIGWFVQPPAERRTLRLQICKQSLGSARFFKYLFPNQTAPVRHLRRNVHHAAVAAADCMYLDGVGFYCGVVVLLERHKWRGRACVMSVQPALPRTRATERLDNNT